VSGNIARVEVTQSFTNPGDEWVAGPHVFALPAGAAVHEMSMQVGGRRMVGEIREREAAHAACQQARDQGRRASLAEQERRPNMLRYVVTADAMPAGPGPAVRAP
jgi:Ca-activated chloride channel family protein